MSKCYDEIIDFIALGTTPEAVVAFRPSEAARERVVELTERSKDGTLGLEERAELEDFLQLEHLMILAKARARQHLELGKCVRWNDTTEAVAMNIKLTPQAEAFNSDEFELDDAEDLDAKLDRRLEQFERGEYLTPDELRQHMQRFKAAWLRDRAAD